MRFEQIDEFRNCMFVSQRDPLYGRAKKKKKNGQDKI